MVEYISKGELGAFTATSAVAVGDPVVYGSRVAIASDNIAKGDTGLVRLEGVYRFDTAETLTLGASVYLKDGKITATATGATSAGVVVGLAGDTLVDVKIG